jgi:hypothetical protein
VPDRRLPPPLFRALICAAFLAGCQTTGQAVAPPEGAQAAAAAPPGAASGEGEARPPAGGKTAVRAVRFNAEEFVGYSPERVLPILGAPDFVRRDGTAQIWQYRATNCILDLFLYTAGKETRVKHAELRPRVPGAEPLDTCYSRMRQERAGQPTS